MKLTGYTIHMNKDINEMSLQELKAVAYDILARIEVEQRNLQVINQMIAKKSQEEVTVAAPFSSDGQETTGHQTNA